MKCSHSQVLLKIGCTALLLMGAWGPPHFSFRAACGVPPRPLAAPPPPTPPQ